MSQIQFNPHQRQNMAYNYSEMKPKLFTEQGQVLFLKIRDKVKELLKISGAVRWQEAVAGIYDGDDWLRFACFDRLVEMGEIRVVPQSDVVSQHTVYVSCYH